MSKKDYIAIADAVKRVPLHEEDDRASIAVELAAAFAADNPRFDEDRFLEAATGGSPAAVRYIATTMREEG